MSTVIARRVASTPVRTASATWAQISAMLAPDASSDARAELDKVKGVAACSISSEVTANDAIVTYDGGPRVRVYCAFNDDAITGDGVNEDPLPRSPTGDGWRMSIPFPKEDVGWAAKELARLSSRITARAPGEEVAEDSSSQRAQATAGHGSVDTSEFFRS